MWKDRLWNVVLVTRTVFKWTWIPLILYLGGCIIWNADKGTFYGVRVWTQE